MNDPREDTAVIDSMRAATTPRKMLLNLRPSLVVQPIKLSHPTLPSRSLESETLFIR